jgi:hypothetical protein
VVVVVVVVTVEAAVVQFPAMAACASASGTAPLHTIK